MAFKDKGTDWLSGQDLHLHLSGSRLGSEQRERQRGGQALRCLACLQRQGGRAELKSQEGCPCGNGISLLGVLGSQYLAQSKGFTDT